jgi:hypothetical protein
MITVAVSEAQPGFEQRTFECLKCGHVETRQLASDPLHSGAGGWTNGQLRPPQ